jgi:hypothetical protein
VPDAPDASELLGIEVAELAGACAIVPPRRLARLERRQAAQAEPVQMTGHGAARQTQTIADLRTGHAVLPTPPDDHVEPWGRQLVGDEARRRAAVLQAGIAAEAGEPLAHGAHADLEGGRRSGHGPTVLEHAAHHHRSTKGRGAGILVGVHPGGPSAVGDGAHQPPARPQPG